MVKRSGERGLTMGGVTETCRGKGIGMIKGDAANVRGFFERGTWTRTNVSLRISNYLPTRVYLWNHFVKCKFF